MKDKKPAKYKPVVLGSFKYRGFKINEVQNKKTKRREFKVRFQINNKEFYLTEENRKNLEEMIDETLYQERRAHHELPVIKHSPEVRQLFDEHLQRLKNIGDRKKISIFERVSARLTNLLPAGIKINQLKKAHFQKYIDERLSEINPQSESFILPDTVNKELSAISVVFKNASLYFAELEDAPVIQIPKAQVKKDRRRERLVEKTFELDVLLEFLRRNHRNKTTAAARRRIADELEIKYETGLRRAEVAILEKHQYRRAEAALRDVKRLKTGTVTKFFPLSRRAVEVIESRLDSDSKYIFSKDGKPNEGDYKTLKYVCGKIDLPYGTFKVGGFVPHDLRHNFATDISRVTDIETAKSLTGHTGEHILTYLHTDEKRQREAMNRREGRELKAVLTELYNQVKNDNISVSAFIEKAEILIKNG